MREVEHALCATCDWSHGCTVCAKWIRTVYVIYGYGVANNSSFVIFTVIQMIRSTFFIWYIKVKSKIKFMFQTKVKAWLKKIGAI